MARSRGLTVALAAALTSLLAATTIGAAATAAAPAGSLPAGGSAPAAGPVPVSGSGAASAASAVPVAPRVTPQRTVIRRGHPVTFAATAAPGSTVTVSALRNNRWTALTRAVTVPRSGAVRLSAPLPTAGNHLVRADVLGPDRLTRHGFGPYVVTVVAPRAPMPRYVEYPLSAFLRSPAVTGALTTAGPVTVGGTRFRYDAAVRAATYPAWNPGVVAKATGCIGIRLEFALADTAGAPEVANLRVANPWAGRGAQGYVARGATGVVATVLDGGPLRIEAASGGSRVYLRGTVTCPRGALNR